MINTEDSRYAEYNKKVEEIKNDFSKQVEHQKISASMLDGGDKTAYKESIKRLKALKKEYSFLFTED